MVDGTCSSGLTKANPLQSPPACTDVDPQPTAGVVHASVPDHERPFAKEVLSGSLVTAKPPGEIPLASTAETRVLSVSSQDRLPPDYRMRYPRLQAVVTRSTGCDRLPLAQMREEGIRAYHLDGYATQSVAQHTLLLLLALLRRLPEAGRLTQGTGQAHAGQPRWDRSFLQGRHLDEVTIGVVGTGRIGSRVVRLLTGLGGRTIGYDIAPNAELARREGFRYADSLHDLLSHTDAVTIHVPLTSQTHKMIGREALSLMRRQAVLVNTARGDIIDQTAVAAALQEKRLAGYAADVLPGEPEPGDLPRFQHFDNVVMTPHLAAYDGHALRSRYETTARVVRCLLAQEETALAPYRAY